MTKVIVVPKDKDAERKLDRNQASSEELIELFVDESELRVLFNVGFFAAFNHIAGTLIDDFEDDSITQKAHIEQILRSNIFSQFKSNDQIAPLVGKIERLFRDALTCNTGVYFFF